MSSRPPPSELPTTRSETVKQGFGDDRSTTDLHNTYIIPTDYSPNENSRSWKSNPTIPTFTSKYHRPVIKCTDVSELNIGLCSYFRCRTWKHRPGSSERRTRRCLEEHEAKARLQGRLNGGQGGQGGVPAAPACPSLRCTSGRRTPRDLASQASDLHLYTLHSVPPKANVVRGQDTGPRCRVSQ